EVRREQALLERLGQLREAGAARAELPFRFGAFDELTDLRAGGVHHLEHLVVGLATLGGEELDHAEHVAPAPDRDPESAVQAIRGGHSGTSEVAIFGDVRDPCRCSLGPDAPWEPGALPEGR